MGNLNAENVARLLRGISRVLWVEILALEVIWQQVVWFWIVVLTAVLII